MQSDLSQNDDIDISAIGGRTDILEEERNGSLKNTQVLSAIDQSGFSQDSFEEKRKQLVLERLRALQARGNIKNASEYYSWSRY